MVALIVDLFWRGCESLYLTSNNTMATTVTLLFVGSQAIVSVNKGSMRMAVYLLGRSVGNFNLEIAIDKADIFVFQGKK